MDRVKAGNGVHQHGASHETLRLFIALYVMGAAIGLWPVPGAPALITGLFAPATAASLYGVALFGTAWMVLVGLHLPAASLGLMALVLSGAALGGTIGPAEILLTLALLPLASGLRLFRAFGPAHTGQQPRGRIRLTRITAPRGCWRRIFPNSTS